MIKEWLEGLAEGICSAARESRLLAVASAKQRSPRLLNREGWLFQLRQHVLRWGEQSPVGQLGNRLFTWCMAGCIGDLGLFMATVGAVAFSGEMLLGKARWFELAFWAALAWFCGGLPLLLSRRSIGRSMTEGRLLQWLLFSVCQFPQERYRTAPVGKERRFTAMLLGGLTGLMAITLSPQVTLLFFLLPLIFLLFFKRPELPFLITATVFPLINLSAHPTVILAVILAISSVLCVEKLLTGRRQIGFGGCDLLAISLALLWWLGGTVGKLQSVFLLTAWIPMRLLFEDRLWRRRLLGGLCISTVGVSVLGILQYVSGKAELKWVDASRFGDIGGRVCGVFDNPNVLAVFLLLGMPLLLVWTTAENTTGKRILGWIGFLFTSLCLVFTWSRGAWLGGMAATLLFLLCFSRGTLMLLLLLPLPLWAVLPLLPHSVSNRFSGILMTGESSVRYRINTWKGVCRMLAEHPFGIGCGDEIFHFHYPAYAVSGTERVMHSHMLWLQLGVEIGILGGALFLWLLLRLLRGVIGFLRYSERGFPRAEAVALSASILGVTVMGVFDSVWYCKPLFWLLWCLLALLCNVTAVQ